MMRMVCEQQIVNVSLRMLMVFEFAFELLVLLLKLTFVEDRKERIPHLFQFNLFVEILLMFSEMFDAQEPFTMVQALKDPCGVSV